MALKQHPWDKVIKYKDWQENIPEENTPVEKASTPSPVSNAATETLVSQISGANVESDSSNDQDDILNMIHNLNKGNLDYVKQRKSVEDEKNEKEKDAQAQELQKEITRRNTEQYDREQAEFDKIAFEKAEAKAKEAAALQAQKEKSIFYKASNLFSKPKKKDKAPGKEKIEVSEDIPKENDIPEDTVAESQNSEVVLPVPSLLDKDDNSLHLLNEDADISDISASSDMVVEAVAPRHKHKKQVTVQKIQSISEKETDELCKSIEDNTDTKQIENSKESGAVSQEQIQETDNEASVESIQTENDETSNKSFLEENDKASLEDNNALNSDFSEDTMTDESILALSPIDKYNANEHISDTSKNSHIFEETQDIQTQEQISDNASAPKEKHKKSFFNFGKKKNHTDLDKNDILNDVPKNNTPVNNPNWEFLATHDELTGLLNQRAYEEFKKSDIHGIYVIAMIDINNLKFTNDTYGHTAGNSLITAVSDQIKSLFSSECGYRIGGDEFAIFIRYKNAKKAENEIVKKKESFYSALKTRTNNEKASGLVYSASFGYAISDNKKDFTSVSDKADKLMYAEKKAYKEAHPEFNMRPVEAFKNNTSTANSSQSPTNPEDYDNMLSKDQQELKKYVKDNHIQVSPKSTQEIIREIQSRSSEIVAILIASPTFDQLFILLSADTFIGVCNDTDSIIDYSYLYIMYKTGPQYKGSDEYLLQVKQVFEAIGNGIASGQIKSEKEILKIKGINIFKKIYVSN